MNVRGVVPSTECCEGVLRIVRTCDVEVAQLLIEANDNRVNRFVDRHVCNVLWSRVALSVGDHWVRDLDASLSNGLLEAGSADYEGSPQRRVSKEMAGRGDRAPQRALSHKLAEPKLCQLGAQSLSIHT